MVYEYIKLILLIIVLITFVVVIIYMVKKPKKELDNVFESIFKKQLDILKQIEEEKDLQSDVFNSFNHNIVGNYKILLQMKIREAITYFPNDVTTILNLYEEHNALSKKPDAVLDEIVKQWKISKNVT